MRLIFILTTLCILISAAVQITYKKYSYVRQFDSVRTQFYDEQADMLRRLGKSLQESVKKRDINTINKSIADYESVLYALNLPASMQVVIFDAPQQVIGMLGELAPDENYYMQIMHTPSKLAFSRQYIKSVMPDFKMINYGLGIIDHQSEMLGILEVKIPAATIQAYFTTKLDDDLMPYIFKSIILHTILLVAIVLLYVWFERYRKQQVALIKQLRSVIEVNHKYAAHDFVEANVNILQLIEDLYAVNYMSAQQFKADLSLPKNDGRAIFCYINKKELLEVLSTIVKNMLRQAGRGCKVCLQLNVTKDQVGFEFSDNGYYTDLDSGWDEIIDLVEHVHTAYAGNKVIYSVPRVVKDNVVSLEQYCS